VALSPKTARSGRTELNSGLSIVMEMLVDRLQCYSSSYNPHQTLNNHADDRLSGL